MSEKNAHALEVSVNGEVVRVCLPPSGGRFHLSVSNDAPSHMRGYVVAGNNKVDYRWLLPELGERDVLSARMIPALHGDDPDVITNVTNEA